MPTKRCCCGGACFIGEDDFERDDSNPPSGPWSVVSGEWEIKVDPNRPGNQILSSITAGPIITTKRQPAPLNLGARYATITTFDIINIPASGTKTWGIICGFKDANNFDWVELTLRASDQRISPIFYRRTGGVDAVVADVTTNPQNTFGAGFEPFFNQGTPLDFATFAICYSTLEWSLGITDPSEDLKWTVCDGGLDSMPALPYGTFGFLFGEFDNWYHDQHFESREDCFNCECLCAESRTDKACWPDTLRLTALAGPGFRYNTVPPDPPPEPCPEEDTGEWDIDVLLHRCSSPDASYLSIPTVPAYPSGAYDTYVETIFPLDTGRFTWYSDPFESEGTYYWFVVHCQTDAGITGLYVAIMPYADTDPYEQSTNGPFLSGIIGDLSFTRVNPLTGSTPPGYSIPQIGAFACNPIYLNYLAGVENGDLLDNRISESAECAGPMHWHTLVITEP